MLCWGGAGQTGRHLDQKNSLKLMSGTYVLYFEGEPKKSGPQIHLLSEVNADIGGSSNLSGGLDLGDALVQPKTIFIPNR